MPQVIADYNAAHDLALWSHASAEAQVAAIADDIAYDAHDLDDGLRADLFALADLAERAGDRRAAAARCATTIRGIDPARLTHELVRRLIGKLIEDVIDGKRAAPRRGGADIVRRGARAPAARWSASRP